MKDDCDTTGGTGLTAKRSIKLGLITPDSGDACSVYRGVGPYMRLPIDLTVYDGKKGFFLWQAIMDSDIIMLHRPFTPQQVNIAQTIKASGKPLIVDWDDDSNNLPDWNPYKKHFTGCLPNLAAVAKLADVVTVTSSALHEAVRLWSEGTARVVEVPNAIDDHFKRLPKLPRKKRVVWRGSGTHAGDLDLCRDQLKDFAAKGYEVCFFGDTPAWAHELPNHRAFPVSDYCNFIVTLNSAAPEYMLVNLVPHQFNRAKSDIASQEAYLIGAKLLHNHVGEYMGLPETSEPRWLSSVNHIRMDLLEELCALS